MPALKKYAHVMAAGALRNFALAAIAGVLLNFAFPNVGWWPAAIVSLALLWWVLELVPAWQGFLLGWVFGIAFLLPQVWWAFTSVGAVPWLALSIAEGVAFGLFGTAWAHVRRSRMLMDGRAWVQPLAFALLWTGMEELRSMVPFGGFPWGRVAFSQVESPLGNLAWAGGAPLVTFFTVVAGGLLGLAFEAGRAHHWVVMSAAPFLAVMVILSGIFVPIDSQASDGFLRVGVVQGNVPNLGLDSLNQARQVTKNHLAGTKALMATNPGPIDLLIWPENAADIDPRVDQETSDDVTSAALLAGAPLLLGTIDYSPADGRYNTSLLWSPAGQVLDEYRKQRPAPFAEYIPIRSFARHFSSAVDRVTKDVLPGTAPATMELVAPQLSQTITLGTVICFEVAYDEIVRGAVRKGAEIVIVQTNNATFGTTPESTQQLAMTRLRAIELGRTTIQASTVGVSAIVLPDGHVMQETDLFTAEQMYASVPLRSEMTPAARLGAIVRWTMLSLALIVTMVAMRRRVANRYEW